MKMACVRAGVHECAWVGGGAGGGSMPGDEVFGLLGDGGAGGEVHLPRVQHHLVPHDGLLREALPEGPPPVQHLVQDDPKRPHIHLRSGHRSPPSPADLCIYAACLLCWRALWCLIYDGAWRANVSRSTLRRGAFAAHAHGRNMPRFGARLCRRHMARQTADWRLVCASHIYWGEPGLHV